MARSISTSDDYLDSRDIQERIEELEATDEELDEDDAAELAIWNELKEETEGEGWEFGIFFFHEDKAENQAMELASDIHGTGSDMAWPFNCIDWDQATREFLMDYSSIEIDGNSYYYREA